jgi:molybdopterin-guanine dinucleotide biosynthesis protein A
LRVIAPRSGPIGVILAGGIGRRIGGAKALAPLHGRPLIEYPLEALRAVLADVAVIAKPDTELPRLSGVRLWIEPPEPRHPLTGITVALARADGRPVMICAADLPFVTPALIERLARHPVPRAPVVVAGLGEEIQPLLGCYHPGAAALLSVPAAEGRRPLREVVGEIAPHVVEVEDPDELFNINAPEDLVQAGVMLERRVASRR